MSLRLQLCLDASADVVLRNEVRARQSHWADKAPQQRYSSSVNTVWPLPDHSSGVFLPPFRPIGRSRCVCLQQENGFLPSRAFVCSHNLTVESKGSKEPKVSGSPLYIILPLHFLMDGTVCVFVHTWVTVHCFCSKNEIRLQLVAQVWVKCNPVRRSPFFFYP